MKKGWASTTCRCSSKSRTAGSPGPVSMTLHSTLSWLALLFGLGHGLLLLFDDYFTYTLGNIFLPFTGPYRPEVVGLGTLAFWLFMIGIIPLNLPFTWLYNNTGRSILAVILFHSMVNFTGELIALTERADTLSILLWFVTAIGIAVSWGAKSLTREKVVQA